MALQSRMVVAGMSAVQAVAAVGTTANNLTATGSTQATAIAIGADLNRFTTVGPGSGAILPAMNPGDSVECFNAGANALLIYPPVGASINALGTNVAYSVAVATPYATFSCITPTQYHSFQSA
jgi:hypothetical protein